MSKYPGGFAARIESACDLSGLSLKAACEELGLNYQTLYHQMKKGREIPASTIGAFSAGLGIPLDFFFSTDDLAQSELGNGDTLLARTVNQKRAKLTRAGFDVTTDHILDWHREEGGRLKNWHWFADQVDVYKPIECTDNIMHPISFGQNSITLERLMLRSKEDYYQTVGAMSQKRLDHAMESHRAVWGQSYVVTEEVIDEVIKGQKVLAGYRKVTMRVRDEENQPVTAVFSKLTWLRA